MFLLVVWQLLEAGVGHRDEDGKKRVAKRLVVGRQGRRLRRRSGSAASRSRSAPAPPAKGEETITAKLMDLPAGQLLVGAGRPRRSSASASARSTAPGPRTSPRSWTARAAAASRARRTSRFGKVGYTAKGVAIAIVGGLFVYAAITHDAKKSGGLDQALFEVLDQPFGPFLLGRRRRRARLLRPVHASPQARHLSLESSGCGTSVDVVVLGSAPGGSTPPASSPRPGSTWSGSSATWSAASARSTAAPRRS